MNNVQDFDRNFYEKKIIKKKVGSDFCCLLLFFFSIFWLIILEKLFEDGSSVQVFGLYTISVLENLNNSARKIIPSLTKEM